MKTAREMFEAMGYEYNKKKARKRVNITLNI